MKKFLFLLSSLMITLTIYSQESKMVIGLQGAPSLTSMRGNSIIDTCDNRYVISPGITFDYYFSRNLVLRSGLAFERKGNKTKMPYADMTGTIIGSYEYTWNYDYLTLPLMVTYSTSGKINFYFGGGAFLSFLISQKNIQGAFGNTPEQIDNTIEYTKRIDVGLSLIVGIHIPITDKLLIDVGVRDYLGLINTSKIEIVNNGSMKTNSIGLVLGLKYKL